MKVAALGDAHLGRSYYSLTAANGVNRRELDFEESFRAAVDLALAQEPDLVVWLGDVFDHPRPTYRSFRVAQSALARSADRESNVFPRVAREGRKFKVGLCAVTQQPKLLDDELLSQFNTFFVLGLADEKDRNILRASSKQDISALGPEIQTLMPGECLLANLEAPFAVPAKVDLYADVVRDCPPPPVPRPVAPPNVAALVD